MSAYETKEAVAELVKPEYVPTKAPSLPSQKLLAGRTAAPTPSFSARAAAFKANPPPAPPSTDMEYTRDVPMRDGRLSEMRIYQPDNSTTAVRPLFVLVHGGGFCVGNNHAPGFRSRLIAAANDMTVVNVSYRLAPEHPFPAAPNDVWDAVAWLSEPDNAQQLGADPALGFYIGGISAGGNLAAVTAQRWVSDKRTPALRGLWLHVPVLLDERIVPAAYGALFFSRAQNADALVIDRAADDYVRAAYAPDVTSPLYSPFNAARPHEGMPRVHLQVAGQDPVRDDGLIYEKALRAHGVETRLDVYPGLPHAFDGVFPQLKASDRAKLDMLQGIAWLMGKTVDVQRCKQLIEESRAAVPSGPPL